MIPLRLSLAIGDYDRIRPIADGTVRIDGVDPVMSILDPEEIFFRAFKYADFDICELSLSSYTVKTAEGDSPYTAVPVFPSRAFRHTSVYIRTDRGITRPEDLKGRRVGVPEYQLTANVWVRVVLEEYGVRPSDITWVRGGYEHPGREEKITLQLPSDLRLESLPPGATISSALADGTIDAVIGPRAPSCFERGAPHVGRLWADPVAAASEWYGKHKIFPIMHVLGIRKDVAEQHRYLPGALVKAFEEAKSVALAKLTNTAATKVTLPFVEERLQHARALMGDDFWSYGLEPNRHVLDVFLQAHHAQGLSSRRLKPEDLFHPASLEAFRL
ncbi:ABC transporter substrate-binding protein [Roseomonas sp. SSH11]|uniref:ABC transporter substrate-binding protein n=1 Tax=Pararoseomonas baculiformis TaxID=2820812 RepID=A0ABS4AJK2_9PROT|nr:ABC transporter substrate-binding protein [Pararoseomonas baculiformis]MBP0447210.1 ABC transporter substrate-binding protein [Pararoseomonas baculiformis]